MVVRGSSDDQPRTVDIPPSGVWRVARSSGPMEFSWIESEDAVLPRAGNRFDVPGGGVLYCATHLVGCYAETLARFRPTPKMLSLLSRTAPHFMAVGGVPADWRHRRCRLQVRAATALPFLDVEAVETREHLQRELAEDLDRFGVVDLDVSVVRGGNRLVTRLIARWAYDQTDQAGFPSYGGIRYTSRLDDHECWGIFDGTEVTGLSRSAVELGDPALVEVQEGFRLRVF